MTARPISTDGPVVVRDELPPPVVDDRLPPPSVYDSLPYERVERSTTTHTRAAFSLAQLFHAVCGIALTAFGAVTMAKAGFDRPLGEQTAEVLKVTQTTAIGIAEVSAGVLLILAALSPRGRIFGGFIGALVGVGGIVVLAASNDVLSDLHTERALGWVLLVIGGLSLLAAFFPTHVVDSTHAEVRPEVRV
jgi:hypothetical protein